MKHMKFIGISGGLVALAFVMASIIPLGYEDNFAPSATLSSEEVFGEQITEIDAKENTNITFKTPTKLPESTELSSIHAEDDHVFIIYSNANMKDLETFNTPGVDIVVYMQPMEHNPIPYLGQNDKPLIITSERDGQETKTFEIEQTSFDYVKTTIADSDAVFLAKETTDIEYSELKWWDNGTLYQVYADLPQRDLAVIANSMQ